MANLIEFLRLFLSYLLNFAVIAAVSAAGAFVGTKLWKQKVVVEKVTLEKND